MYLPDLSHKKGERHAPFWVRRSPALIGQVMTGSLTNYSVAKVVIKTKSPKVRLQFIAKVAAGDVAWRGLERGGRPRQAEIDGSRRAMCPVGLWNEGQRARLWRNLRLLTCRPINTLFNRHGCSEQWILQIHKELQITDYGILLIGFLLIADIEEFTLLQYLKPHERDESGQRYLSWPDFGGFRGKPGHEWHEIDVTFLSWQSGR